MRDSLIVSGAFEIEFHEIQKLYSLALTLNDQYSGQTRTCRQRKKVLFKGYPHLPYKMYSMYNPAQLKIPIGLTINTIENGEQRTTKSPLLEYGAQRKTLVVKKLS